MRNTTTDTTQTNVSPETLARRIMRVMSAVLFALTRKRMITYRLDGYVSQRAAAKGQGPSTVYVTVTSLRDAEDVTTGRATVYGIASAVRPNETKRTLLGLRSYNLYKARAVRSVPTPADHVADWKAEIARKEREAELANG